MSDSSLRPILDLEIPDLAVEAWIEVARRAHARAHEIETQRNPDQQHVNLRLYLFEYHHFYSAWIAVAFRLRACATHSQDFTSTFRKTRGTAQDIDLYYEDDALFDFFVKGLSALESFLYSLYALGALICTPTQATSVPPPAQFPLLHPYNRNLLRKITPTTIRETFERVFPGQPITSLIGHVLEDNHYKRWSQIRNVLAHRVATAGRIFVYRHQWLIQTGKSPSVYLGTGDIHFDWMMTIARYEWLKKTINQGVEETSAFAVQQLAYTEDQLSRLV